jgi:hypothetical protein
MAPHPALTQAEQQVAATKGEPVDLREGIRIVLTRHNGQTWGPARTVTARFLRRLLVAEP